MSTQLFQLSIQWAEETNGLSFLFFFGSGKTAVNALGVENEVDREMKLYDKWLGQKQKKCSCSYLATVAKISFTNNGRVHLFSAFVTSSHCRWEMVRAEDLSHSRIVSRARSCEIIIKVASTVEEIVDGVHMLNQVRRARIVTWLEFVWNNDFNLHVVFGCALFMLSTLLVIRPSEKNGALPFPTKAPQRTAPPPRPISSSYLRWSMHRGWWNRKAEVFFLE